MNRNSYSRAMLEGMHGIDGQGGGQALGYDPTMGGDVFGADDPIRSAGITTLNIGLTIASTAALSVDLFSQAHLDAGALPTGIASPTLADYKAIVRYLQSNPSQIVSLSFQSSEAANTGAPVLSSLRIIPTRKSPFGSQSSNQLNAQNYQTTQDFQANRLTVPVVVTLDTVSYLTLQTDANGSGGVVTFNLALSFGRRLELRRSMPSASPMVNRPGGRGPQALSPAQRGALGGF